MHATSELPKHALISPLSVSPVQSCHRHKGHIMSEDTRLSVIAEDGDAQPVPPVPPIPPRASNRPLGRRFHLGDPPRHSYEKSPPPYSVWQSVTGPKGERLADVRNNKYVARRGGWKRLCLVAFGVTALLAGLIVGLVVGLRRKNSNE